MDVNQNQQQEWEGAFPSEQSHGFSKGKIIFLFVIGFLLGVSVKAQAIKSITMGYEDYKASINKSNFAISKAEEKEDQQQEADDASANPQPAAEENGDNNAVMETK